MADFQAKFFPAVFTNEQLLKTGAGDPYCKYNNHVLQLIVSSLYIPAAFVSIFAASFARKTGRKVTPAQADQAASLPVCTCLR